MALDVAIRKADGSTAVDWTHVGVRTAPPLPVAPALQTLLPDGLRRGSTVSVTGSECRVTGRRSEKKGSSKMVPRRRS